MAGLAWRRLTLARRSLTALALTMLLAGVSTPSATGATLTPSGPRRSLPSQFFGLNAESIVEPEDDLLLTTNSSLRSKLANLPVGLLRIPGGTTSQWLDWETGEFISAAASPFAGVPSNRIAITMSRWASIVRSTGATPLWDLNVLTSTLSDQVAMLEEAVRLGMPVRYIELGNELWNPGNTYTTEFPTGAAYGTAMNSWITTLRQLFPDAQIAVEGADETVPGPLSFLSGGRYAEWNESLLSTVRGENAIAIHPYWNLPGNASPGSNVPATLIAGQDHWNGFVSQTLAQLPAGLQVWLTEYNQTSLLTAGGTQIWAQALSVAAVQFDQLEDPTVTVSLLHDIVGGLANPQDHGTAKVFPLFSDGWQGSRVLGRTALGYTVPLIYSTIASATAVQQLSFHGVSEVGDQPGVDAIEVFGPEPGALIVNLAAQPVTLKLPGSLRGAARVTSLSAPAASQPSWIPADHVTTATRAVHGSVTVPPYSLDRLALLGAQAPSGTG